MSIEENLTQLYTASIVECLDEGIVLVDNNAKILYVNTMFNTLLALQAKAAMPLPRLFKPECEVAQFITTSLNNRTSDVRDILYTLAPNTTSWLRINATPLPFSPKITDVMLFSFREISELKRTEREIWQAEKMSALGRLAASVAHEIGNPLGAMDIQLQLLEEDIASLDESQHQRLGRRLGIARGEIRRLDGIVQNFLRFSRPPTLHLQPLHVNDLLHHIYALLEPEAKERGITLDLCLAPTLPVRNADENLLSQALLNILINAFQAVDTDAQIQLKSHFDQKTSELIIAVSDNGHGIAPADLERILEFYYTTKDEGTGLGLSIAQRIIHQHGGTLKVASQLNHGTVVTIHLPI